MAAAHIAQRGQVDERWRTHLVAIRSSRSVAHQIKSQFTLRRFDPAVGIANWWLERFLLANIRHRGVDMAAGGVWQPLDHLLENMVALAHLLDSQQEAVVHIAD